MDFESIQGVKRISLQKHRRTAQKAAAVAGVDELKSISNKLLKAKMYAGRPIPKDIPAQGITGVGREMEPGYDGGDVRRAISQAVDQALLLTRAQLGTMTRRTSTSEPNLSNTPQRSRGRTLYFALHTRNPLDRDYDSYGLQSDGEANYFDYCRIGLEEGPSTFTMNERGEVVLHCSVIFPTAYSANHGGLGVLYLSLGTEYAGAGAIVALGRFSNGQIRIEQGVTVNISGGFLLRPVDTAHTRSTFQQIMDAVDATETVGSRVNALETDVMGHNYQLSEIGPMFLCVRNRMNFIERTATQIGNGCWARESYFYDVTYPDAQGNMSSEHMNLPYEEKQRYG